MRQECAHYFCLSCTQLICQCVLTDWICSHVCGDAETLNRSSALNSSLLSLKLIVEFDLSMFISGNFLILFQDRNKSNAYVDFLCCSALFVVGYYGNVNIYLLTNHFKVIFIGVMA